MKNIWLILVIELKTGMIICFYSIFSAILTSIQSVYIQFQYGDIRVNVQNISLISAVKGTSGKPVTFVEHCTCDPASNVQGQF